MLRANYVPGYFRRFLFVFLGVFGYGLYFLYDGAIGYPKKLEIAKVYYEMPEEDRTDVWREKAKQNGWSFEEPKKPEEIERDIIGQWIWAGICMLISIPAFLKWFLAKGTWIEGDEQAIRNNKGKELAIDQITKINKRKWEEKGLATIYYSDNGKPRKFVMDDFKFDREPMGKLMRFAEANLTDEQIVGGARETSPEQDADQKSLSEATSSEE